MKNYLFLFSAFLAANLPCVTTAQTKSDAPPTDPQIAMIAVTADTVDIDAGKLAAEKSSNPKVKEFAQMMVRDHTSVNKKATALANKLNLTPEESDTSRSLKSDGDKNLEKLRGLNGAEFDKAYIDNEVAYHESVINAVTNTLIPNTKNAELKKLLQSAGPSQQRLSSAYGNVTNRRYL
jgi:putative membrane protein